MNALICQLEPVVRAIAKQNGLMLRKVPARKMKEARLNIYGLTEITTNARVAGHRRMGGRGVSLEACAHILSELDPSLKAGGFLERGLWGNLTPLPNPEHPLRSRQFDQLIDRLIQTAPEEELISKRNYFARIARLDQIMRKPLGENWEFFLSYDFAAIPAEGDYRKMKIPLERYGKLRGESMPVMLEKLDRKGRLVAGLKAEEIQAAAQQENELWVIGQRAGRDWASEMRPPKGFNHRTKIPNNLAGAAEIGVVGEYNAYGKSWFDGFIGGLMRVWKPRPTDPVGSEGAGEGQEGGINDK